MSRVERRRVANACAAVIAAAITEAITVNPAASPEEQARHAVRALRADGWHITAVPACVMNPQLAADEPAVSTTTTEGITR
ncbi:hypothetical protein AB0H29_08280 [Streptomyces thermolilacinus]